MGTWRISFGNVHFPGFLFQIYINNMKKREEFNQRKMDGNGKVSKFDWIS